MNPYGLTPTETHDYESGEWLAMRSHELDLEAVQELRKTIRKVMREELGEGVGGRGKPLAPSQGRSPSEVSKKP